MFKNKLTTNKHITCFYDLNCMSTILINTPPASMIKIKYKYTMQDLTKPTNSRTILAKISQSFSRKHGELKEFVSTSIFQCIFVQFLQNSLLDWPVSCSLVNLNTHGLEFERENWDHRPLIFPHSLSPLPSVQRTQQTLWEPQV